jgi:transcriptional regulator with XRE-family HTH domain
MSEQIRSPFGDFLRTRREQLAPAAVGLTAGRRRTPGLRRQEVAELAGIGIDWYIRLEQGRAISPSAETLDALSRALRLTKVEQAHLRTLARNSTPRLFSREVVSDATRRLLAGLTQPAYITGRRFDVLAWNEAAAEAFTDFGEMPEEDRNILIFLMLNPDARRLFGDGWENEAKRIVAHFRATHDLWVGDPAFAELLKRLSEGSQRFARWWEAHEIWSGGAGRKVLHHPTRGVLTYEYATFQANDDPALRLAIFTPN